MKIVFVSNTFHHHQANVSDNLYEVTNGNYAFIETEPMRQDRLQLGWKNDNYPPYVIQAWKGKTEEKRCMDEIIKADVIIYGAISPKYIMKIRSQNQNKILFVYSERLFKKDSNAIIKFLKGVKYHFLSGNCRNSYLLCASAYAAADYNNIGLYQNKTYKYGYFPEYQKKSYDSILELKKTNQKLSLLWCGRLIEWKHPDIAILIAEYLKSKGFDFCLDIIGDGDMKGELKRRVEEKDLINNVIFHGAVDTSTVHTFMERADIYLFTSDRGEGWGAVLNEAMNSGCAVVANINAGSTPYLVTNGKNGFVYSNYSELQNCIELLVRNQELRENLGKEAYRTINEEWNGKVVAERFINFANEIKKCGECKLYGNGVLSKC